MMALERTDEILQWMNTKLNEQMPRTLRYKIAAAIRAILVT